MINFYRKLDKSKIKILYLNVICFFFRLNKYLLVPPFKCECVADTSKIHLLSFFITYSLNQKICKNNINGTPC